MIDKQRESIPEAVINKAKSLLSSQLKAFSPSLREKITTLYNKYSSDMKKITEPEGHDILGITKFYSKDEFEKLIGKFIDIRNKASHAGIIWNGGEKIFNHLTLLIYFSILDRAGFTLNESSAILSYLFIF